MSQDLASQLFRPYLSTWLRERIERDELQPGSVVSGNAAILYADLSGFTQLTAAYAAFPDGAERLHEALNRCYGVLVETVGAFGGDVPAIAGDALTAWWPGSTDLDQARRCGGAMLAAVAAMAPLQTPAGPFRLELRIGVSIGLVHAALAGLPSHGVHLVLSGPALHAATTAERTGRPGAIHLAEPTVLAAGELVSHPACEGACELSCEHFLPPAFAERLRLHDLVAEYRRCVPVFAAFQMPPQPADLHPLVAQVQAVVQRWGGWLNEIEVGDKGPVLVLLFGAPLARGDDASRAVGCCLELRERGLIARAGVTLGILFVGAVGSARRRVYTAQGDDMNLAAHLMQRAAPGEILVSGRVRHDVTDRYPTSPPEVIVTKGHAEGVPVSRVIASGHAERHSATGRRFLPEAAALVGRVRERQSIAAAAAAAQSGRATLLLVEGESGIGKSYVLQELLRRWAGAGLAAMSAECSSGGMSGPLLPWRPILAELCGLEEGAGQRRQLAMLEQTLLAPLAEAGQAAVSLLVAALGLGGRIEAELSEADEAQLLALAAALVARQVATGPLLIVLEDVHWADEASVRLAVLLLERCQGLPLLLALSHRPLDAATSPSLAGLALNPAAVRVAVGRLSSDEVGELIAAQLGVSVVHEDLRRHVERHTEGQPLFIREYLRVLRQHELIRVEDETARLVRSYVSVQVSSSAQGVIQARVDRLDPATRLTLKVAAVLGRSFTLRLLTKIHPAGPSDRSLREQLQTLITLEIIDLELADPERVYRFKHGITHEVAYTSLLFGQRRQLHAAVADWYEAAYATEIAAGSAPMAVFDLLTDHLARAEQWPRLAHYARSAAEQAARQHSNGVALRYVEQALRLTSEAEGRFELLLLRVALNERVGNYVGQGDDLAELAALAAEQPGQLAMGYADYYQLRYLLAVGSASAVKDLAPAALGRLRAAGPGSAGAIGLLRAAVNETMGAACLGLGEDSLAARLLRRALRMCRAERLEQVQAGGALPDRDTIAARALNGLGRLETNPARAARRHRQALATACRAGDWCAETLAREGLGRALLAGGDLEGASEQAKAALHVSSAVGDQGGQSRTLRLLAAISAARGEYEAASRDAHYALAISAATRARGLEAELWGEVATYAAAHGQQEEAAAAASEALRARHQWQGSSALAAR